MFSAQQSTYPYLTSVPHLGRFSRCMKCASAGLIFAFGVALFRARSFWSGYAQYREQIASAERLVVPPLCLLYAAVQGPAGWTALTHIPYMWALWGLLYYAVLRTVRWRVHLALLLPEACTRATAAVAASLCLHGQLVPGPSLLVLFQVAASFGSVLSISLLQHAIQTWFTLTSSSAAGDNITFLDLYL